MATLNLGNIKFNWKGAYAGGTAYVVDDVVSYSGSSYICKLASTGNLPTNGTYWDQMSSAGTNGTDLTTTLTTQGDILYRDGSGLQRLGAGTAGQVLKTGGSGANVSWGTVSSDWVRLGTSTASDVASLSFDNLFTSDYDIYKIFFHDVYAQTTNIDMYIKYIESNSAVSTGYSYHINQEGYNDGGINSSGYTGSWPTGSASYIRMNGDGLSTTANYHLTGHVEIFNPLGTSAWKAIKGYSTFFVSSKCLHCNFFGRRQSTNALTGIMFGATSNFNGKFHLYGMKNS